MTKRIGIMGGTFNPVHNGHIKLCRAVMSEMELDKTIFIPSFISPHKKNESMPGADERIRMLELALEAEKDMIIDDYEVRKGDISYSIDTIRYLKDKYAGSSLCWIIGADMLFYIEKWYDYVNVLREIGFIAVKREGYAEDKMEKYISGLKSRFGADITISRTEPINISSTMIREKIKNGLSIKGYVHKKVEQYIISNNLYIM
jgi:nicotinate-nucleotide adenylyltransferase